MQKTATRTFVYASIIFGILGVLNVLTLPMQDADRSGLNLVIFKLLLADGFVVLSSFALSVAGKYLNGKL